MRLLAAIGLFLLSLALLFVGVAQRTVWAPPAHQTLAVEYDATNPYVVIPNETLSAFSGIPTITIAGPHKTFIASGRDVDVEAWVADSAHTDVAVAQTGESSKLEVNSVFGTGPLANPEGSDLWRSSASADKTSALTVEAIDGAAVLVASDGFSAAPNKISIRWPIFYDLTPSNVFLISGGLALIGAFVMNILAIRDHKRRRGPRRKVPRAPQGPKTRRRTSQIAAPARGRRVARRVAHGAAGILVVGLLAGCTSADPNASPSASPTEGTVQADPPALVSSQITRILDSVVDAADRADSKRKKALLEDRFIGPALDMRAAHYFLQSKSDKVADLPRIVNEPVTFSLPAATKIWPRSVMVVTDEKSSKKLPQMLVLRQDSPRSRYMVNYVVELMPGAEIPAVSVPEVGAIPAAVDSVYLKVPPINIPETYGDVIDKGSASASAGIFNVTQDKFYQDVSASQKAQIEKLTKGKIRFRHGLGSPRVIALSTTSGGALVAVFMKDSYTIKPNKVGSAVSVSGSEKLMLGSAGSTRGIRSTYGNMMLFYVPALSDKERVRLLGVTQHLLQVAGL